MSKDVFNTMIRRISEVDKDMDVISRLAATNEIIGFALEIGLGEEEGDENGS